MVGKRGRLLLLLLLPVGPLLGAAVVPLLLAAAVLRPLGERGAGLEVMLAAAPRRGGAWG